MAMAVAEEKRVYVRRTNGCFQPDGWVEGKDHHKAAFDIFLSDTNKSSVKVPRQDGGNFSATFYNVKVADEEEEDEEDEEEDEYGNKPCGKEMVYFLFPDLLGEDVHEYRDKYGSTFQIMYNTRSKVEMILQTFPSVI
jgi:hypothetical protein